MITLMNAEISRDSIHALVERLPERELGVARLFLERLALTPDERSARAARDVAIINENAAELNAEAEDVLGYQADA